LRIVCTNVPLSEQFTYDRTYVGTECPISLFRNLPFAKVDSITSKWHPLCTCMM
jgi:hypothetical protein